MKTRPSLKPFCKLDSDITEMRCVESIGLFVVCDDGTRWIIDNNGKKKQIFKVINDEKSI